MKEYVVDFIFRVYVNAENSEDALEQAEYILMDLNNADYDQVNVEEL